jgi:carboxyl-terminal processing protease
LLGCKRSDASENAVDSRVEEKTDAPSSAGEEEDPLADLERRAFPLLVWSAHTVDKEYFDRERFDPRGQLLSALTNLGLHTPEFFAEPSSDGTTVKVRVRASEETFRLDDIDSLGTAADRLEEILVFAQNILDLEAEPLHELEYAAVNGMFAPLDPHTILLTPEEHTDLGVRTKGEFGGIGAQIRSDGRRILVVRVLPGMPAEKSGLLAGDVILRVGVEATVNMSAAEAQALLRGPVGSTIAVRVRRGSKVLSFDIERDTIKVESVVAEQLPGGVSYLRITTFQENTAEQVRTALAAAGAEPKGIIFDLRGNSGGLLVQATEIVDQFVQRGELVIVRSGFGREVDEANEQTLLPAGVGVVILVDEESASAAEIVSGGLKALQRAVIVGRGSFGKGTVQVVRPANPYGRELALKLTVAEYLVAGDHRIQTRGVVPDLELQPVEPAGVPGIVRYYDDERFERARERSRMANHPSAKHEIGELAAERPTATLRYLQNANAPLAELDEEEGGQAMRDPEVRIAREVALAMQGKIDGPARIAELQSAVTKLRAEEDARIGAALGDVGIDWSVGASTKPPQLVVTAEVVSSTPIAAGDPFTLRVKVTNEADEPAHRVHAISDCVHDELDGIEVMFGKIDPGKTAVRELKAHVMPWHSDFTDELTLQVHVDEPGKAPAAETRVMFDVVGSKQPSLSYEFWIVDDPELAAKAPARPPAESATDEPPFTVEGNGDGVLQPGEQVLLAFVAHNAGPGRSPDARAALRNLSGKQGLIEEGLYPLGAIEPGGSKSGAFGITIGEQADPALPFELELVVGDGMARTAAQDKLRFRVLPEAPEMQAASEGVTVRDEAVRLYNGAHPSARVVAEASPGTRLLLGGKFGNWRVVIAGDDSRRLFVPGDLDALEPAASVSRTDVDQLARRVSVLPPEITIDAYPRATSAATVTVAGKVTHPQGVRDVVVMVRPPGPSQFDRKVAYDASPKLDREHAFSVDVPLEPGGNRIAILARDGGSVQQRRDVWIYRAR